MYYFVAPVDGAIPINYKCGEPPKLNHAYRCQIILWIRPVSLLPIVLFCWETIRGSVWGLWVISLPSLGSYVIVVMIAMVRTTGLGVHPGMLEQCQSYSTRELPYFVLLIQINAIQLVVTESDDKFPQEYRETEALCNVRKQSSLSPWRSRGGEFPVTMLNWKW